jgi:hypothetical protein
MLTNKGQNTPMIRSFRLVLANLLMAAAWALRRGCKRCAGWLLAAARLIAPEAGRYLILRSKPQCRRG